MRIESEEKLHSEGNSIVSEECKGDPGVRNDEEGAVASLAAVTTPPPVLRLYDRVLVDAECTHDGSIKHVLKFRNSDIEWKQFESRFLEPQRY